MKTIRSILAAAALLALPLAASAVPTQAMPDQSKLDFIRGAFQVPASACTGSGAPSPCCTGAAAGATCPVYKGAIITSTSTAGAATTTWAGISANEVAASGTYSAGGATLAGYATAVSSNHACVSFTSPVTFTSATLSGRAFVIYCASNCPALDVVSIHCLDGGACAADTTSTASTYTVTLPGGGTHCIN